MKQHQIPEAVYLYDVENVTEYFFFFFLTYLHPGNMVRNCTATNFLDNFWYENVVETQVLVLKYLERLEGM